MYTAVERTNGKVSVTNAEKGFSASVWHRGDKSRVGFSTIEDGGDE